MTTNWLVRFLRPLLIFQLFKCCKWTLCKFDYSNCLPNYNFIECIYVKFEFSQWSFDQRSFWSRSWTDCTHWFHQVSFSLCLSKELFLFCQYNLLKKKYNLVRGLVSAIFSTGWITFYFLLINCILQLFFLSCSKYFYLLTNCTVFSNNPRLGHPPVRVVPKLHGIWTADLTIYWWKWGSDGFKLLVSVVWLVLL